VAYTKQYRSKFTKKSEPKKEKLPRVEREWSSYQKAIFDEVANGTENIQVDALAGSGKTSSLVEAFYYVPKGKTVLMCAFNKDIQVELDARAPSGVTVLTLHSLGYKACLRSFPRMSRQIDKNKTLGYIKAIIGDEREDNDLRNNLQQMVSLCKGYLASAPSDMDFIMDRHGIDTCGKSREEFIGITNSLLEACKKDTNRIDFDDMIWFPIVHRLHLDKSDYVFVDESQDLNKAQIELALASCREGGRIITCGDTNQAIYFFRGADSNAIENIVNRCNSKRLPLSITYRCAKAIVELAQQYVPELEAAPNAKDGFVDYISESDMEQRVGPGDFILSRTNAPLIGWCLTLLKAGIPANIKGRDLAKNMMAMVRKSNAKNVIEFCQWVEQWRDDECERLNAINRDSDVVVDKSECLLTICEGCKSLDDVMFNIDRLFHDGDDHSRVILSTTHKAKGLERKRVFILRSTYRPERGQEEMNLMYVAITRALEYLYLVQ